MTAITPTATTALKHARALASVLLEHGDLLTVVESRMTELAGDRLVDPGARMIHEHLGAGGKRLRARLALAACKALGGRAEYAVDWAAAVELLHNATLVHDDIQDGDRTRRGKPALWARYGASQAINAGDLLLMLPFRALRGYPAHVQSALVQILAEYAETTARGQILELASAATTGEGWGGYFRAVSGKTGTLFALPVRGAAELAGLETDEANSLALTFSSIGILYQLQDDLLDLFNAKGRRSRGSDIYEGRLSAVVLSHLDLHPSDTGEVLEILEKPREETTEQEVSQLIDRFISEGAAERLRDRIDAMASRFVEGRVGASSNIQALVRELVDCVLTPLDLLNGDSHD